MPNSVRSAPAQKDGPSPLTMTTLTSWVIPNRLEDLEQVVAHGNVEGVVEVGAVQPDVGDAVPYVVDDGVEAAHKT